MTFKKTITLFGTLGFLLTLIVGGAGLYGEVQLNAAMREGLLNAEAMRNHMQADMMHDALRGDVLAAISAAQSDRASGIEKASAARAEHVENLEAMVAANAALELSPNIKQALAAAKPDLVAYIAQTKSIMDAALRSAEGAEAKLPEFNESFERLEKKMAALSEMINASQQKTVDYATRSGAALQVTILSTTLIALALGIISMFWIQRRLFKMLGGEPAYAARIAHGIAQGRLDADIQESVKHEGSILSAMKEMQKALKEQIEADRKIADENLRIRNALDKTSTCMMLADTEGVIVYCNEALHKLLREAESNIRKDLPHFNAAAIVGKNFDVFHKNPTHQRGMIVNLKSTYSTQITVGSLIFRLTASPVFDAQGQRIGTTVEWLNRTMEAQAEKELDQLMGAVVEGDFSTRLDTSNKQGFFQGLAVNMNKLLEIVTNGLSDVGRVLNAISRGDLTEKIATEYHGVFGQLKEDTNTTVDRLSETMSRIKEATSLVSTAAQEIAAGNADLSARTEEQASSLEETASSMEELNSTVKLNSDNALQANELAHTSNEIAAKGGEMVKRVVGTMSAIQESSKKIADIIGVIDSIAFQTNILALNAAVEAARAGEQGRGFAVVATEVRSLAQRSAQAAKEIKGLIADSVGRVDDGAKLVQEAGHTMEEVVSSFQKVAGLVTDISLASREQSSGIEQVANAVGQMDEVTQQNAALVEQAAAAAESLEDQVRTLSQTVAMFKLEGLGTIKHVEPARARAAVARGGGAGKSAGGRSKAVPKVSSEELSEEWETF